MKRPWLLPLSPLWAIGSAWRNRRFDRDPSRSQRARHPVISVGSLSAGGAGKTPFVIALAQALQRSGVAVDILSRGYGRNSAHTALRVDPTGAAEQFGDEPLLIARTLNVPVYVAAQRIDAARFAEADASNPGTVHLLDDGFQHRQLARDVDIVLLTAADVHDALLPAGNMREPLRSLRRADIVVLRSDEADALRPVLKRIVAGTEQPAVWEIDRRFTIAGDGPSSHPFAFCGIARPASFRASLFDHGITPATFIPHGDHQRYDQALVDRMVQHARRVGADGWITTAKDAVKVSPQMRAVLEAVGPLAVADVAVHLTDEQACLAHLQHLLVDVSSD